MTKITLILLTVFLTACAAPQSPRLPTGSQWVAVVKKDEFTDVVTKYATIGEPSSLGSIYTVTMHFYPFIGTENGQLYVGIRSGGRYRVPTGTIQIRVDDKEAWTITPEETPIALIPTGPGAPVAAPGMSEELAASFIRASSPFTAVTGEKARNIAREMLAGKTIKYRALQIGGNNSTTGEATVDASLPAALLSIGIDPKSL